MGDPLAQRSALLLCASPDDVIRLIETDGPRYNAAVGCIALHALATLAAPLGADECARVANAACVNKLLLQLGGQLSGGSEADAQGLTSILWALARLSQAECPLLQVRVASHQCRST